MLNTKRNKKSTFIHEEVFAVNPRFSLYTKMHLVASPQIFVKRTRILACNFFCSGVFPSVPLWTFRYELTPSCYSLFSKAEKMLRNQYYTGCFFIL